jgi:hypothetical protein
MQLECGHTLPPERAGRHTHMPPPTARYTSRATSAAGVAPVDVPRERRTAMLLALYVGRTITGATSPTFGHRDSFGKHIADCLENKMMIELRDDDGWVAGPCVDELDLIGPLPPGALGYIRTRAATICRAGRDIEFHQLAHAVHASGSIAQWLRRLRAPCPPVESPTRGVWGADGRFHHWGVALCDWWAEKTRRAQRQWLRDRGRAMERTDTGMYRYFPPAL